MLYWRYTAAAADDDTDHDTDEDDDDEDDDDDDDDDDDVVLSKTVTPCYGSMLSAVGRVDSFETGCQWHYQTITFTAQKNMYVGDG